MGPRPERSTSSKAFVVPKLDLSAGFQVGDLVFLASAGLGKITGLAGKDARGRPKRLEPNEPAAFLIVQTNERTACVPLELAERTLRRPVSPSTAQKMLEVLRGPALPLTSSEPLIERGKKTIHSGSPLEHAELLREMLDLPIPLSATNAQSVRFLSGLVLPEIALVLGVPLEQLQEELRKKYPAMPQGTTWTAPPIPTDT